MNFTCNDCRVYLILVLPSRHFLYDQRSYIQIYLFSDSFVQCERPNPDISVYTRVRKRLMNPDIFHIVYNGYIISKTFWNQKRFEYCFLSCKRDWKKVVSFELQPSKKSLKNGRQKNPIVPAFGPFRWPTAMLIQPSCMALLWTETEF